MRCLRRESSVPAVIRGGLLLLGVLLVGGAVQPAGAQVNAFLEISGVAGDAAESGHENWVTIESFQHRISGAPGPMSTDGSEGRSTGRASVGEISIVKEIDKSRPSLMDACSQGTHFDEVTLRVVEAGGTKRIIYKLERIAVVRYRILSAGDSVLRRYVGISNIDRSSRLEEVTFGYARVTWSDTEEDDEEVRWRR